MQMQSNHQQYNLPVPFEYVDQSTFNGNLPQQNDRVPQLQLSQFQMQNQQTFVLAVGLFRAQAQASSQKSPLHIFAYNLLSQNQFQTETYRNFCQLVVDFMELLVRARNYQPQNALETAAKRCYEAYLANVFASYPILQQVTPPQMQAGLQTAMQMFQQMQRDIQQYKMGGGVPMQQPMQQPQMQMGGNQNFNMGGGANLPPVANNWGTNGTAAISSMPQSSVNFNVNNNQGSDNAYYDAPVVKPLTPVEEFSTDNGMGAYPSQQEQRPMQQPMMQVEETDLPIPTDVSEVHVDPFYYVPTGYRPDQSRPYDKIHNPGGIVICPAHLVDWVRTVGDDQPYSILVNPNEFCRFLVKFPDGSVKEKIVAWNPQMDYLKHELNDDLRRRYYREAGVVHASSMVVSSVHSSPIKDEEVANMAADGHLTASNVPPILLSKTIAGGTDLEIENVASSMVQELLANDHIQSDANGMVLPQHEYRVIRPHQMAVTPELADRIRDLGKSSDLVQLGLELQDLVKNGMLPIRYYRFINERLTDSLNRFTADSLSLSTTLDNFAEEIGEYYDYMATKKDPKFLTIIKANVTQIVGRALYTVMADDDFCIADAAVHYQCGWTLEDLVTLNIYQENALLVSAQLHPKLLEVLKGMINRLTEEERKTHRLYLITSDGAYLEVVRGLLVEKAVLLKFKK